MSPHAKLTAERTARISDDVTAINRWLSVTRLRAAGAVMIFALALDVLGFVEIDSRPVVAVTVALGIFSLVGLCSRTLARNPWPFFYLQHVVDLTGITIGIGAAISGLPALLFHSLYIMVIVPASLVSVRSGLIVAAMATVGHEALLGMEQGWSFATAGTIESLVPSFLFFVIAQQSFFYGSYLERKNAALAELAAERGTLLQQHDENDEKLRLLVEELEGAKDAAQAADRAKSEFLANISHELRTPMTGIIGMTDIVLETDLREEQHRSLSVVRSLADQLLTLMNGLLDFSKIEAGKLDLECVEFTIQEPLSQALRPVAMRAHKRGLELVCEVDADVPETLFGDPVRLRQVMLNLVGNAVKFTHTGEIVVNVGVMSRAAADVELHFSVRDEGIGIPADKQAAIFAAFTQADGSMTRKYGGTGLGLAIAAQLVDLMGGRIWVESAVGRGSTFHFTARFKPARDAPGKEAPLPALRGRRVLVVDDNATQRRVLAALLRRWGAEPRAVTDGETALDSLAAAAEGGAGFALAIIDAQMPGLDGLSLTRRLRSTPALAVTSVVLLTSFDRPEDAARLEDIEASASVTKPIVNPMELYNAAAAALDAEWRAGRRNRTGAAAPPVPSPAHLRVLVADDTPVICTVLMHLLEKRGYSVVTVHDGLEALAAMERTAFDVVLMDVQMPVLDGIETTKEIRVRELGTGIHTPILALSAHAMKGDRERFLEAGMDAYLAKPVQPGDLYAAIDALIKRSSARAAAAAGQIVPAVAGRHGNPGFI